MVVNGVQLLFTAAACPTPAERSERRPTFDKTHVRYAVPFRVRAALLRTKSPDRSFTNQVASRKSTSLANIRLLAINPGVSRRTKRVEDQTTIPEIPEFGSTSQIPDLWLAEGIFPAP
jgi:hypothetical protein